MVKKKAKIIKARKSKTCPSDKAIKDICKKKGKNSNTCKKLLNNCVKRK